jgi:hypothetical protein
MNYSKKIDVEQGAKRLFWGITLSIFAVGVLLLIGLRAF